MTIDQFALQGQSKFIVVLAHASPFRQVMPTMFDHCVKGTLYESHLIQGALVGCRAFGIWVYRACAFEIIFVIEHTTARKAFGCLADENEDDKLAQVQDAIQGKWRPCHLYQSPGIRLFFSQHRFAGQVEERCQGVTVSPNLGASFLQPIRTCYWV